MSRDFIAAPRGVFPDEIPDPERLFGDFALLTALARSTTQHQWKGDSSGAARAFGNVNFMKEGPLGPVKVRAVKSEAHLWQATYDPGVLSMVLDPPNLRSVDVGGGTPDPNLWQVSYNRGLEPVEFAEVNGWGAGPTGWASSTQSSIQWTSAYPELLLVIASFQYVRTLHTRFGSAWDFDAVTPQAEPRTYDIRFKARIGVDGGFVAGTGPDAPSYVTRYRGAGYDHRAALFSMLGVVPLAPGTHNVQLLAGQGFATDAATKDEDEEEIEGTEMAPEQYPPTEGVCIGSRRMFAITFPFGLPLGG